MLGAHAGRRVMETWKLIACALVLLVLIGLTCAWQVYAYHDCLKVGHSRLYCIGRIGR